MRAVIPGVALATVLVLTSMQAMVTRTWMFDEPLWYMRSRVVPCNLSGPDYRFWATDVPALNRWFYWAALKAAGTCDPPGGEKPCWSMRGKAVYFQDGTTLPEWKAASIEEWMRYAGDYAPRDAILTMRLVNVAVYGAMLAMLWWSAKRVLAARWPAAVTVAPLVLSPLFSGNVAFRTWSGDIFMLAASAGALALWLRFHLAGKGATRRAVIAVGLAAGLAVSSKLTGILVLAAFAAYLATASRGLERLYNPLMACGAALVAFAVVNPVMLSGNPLGVCVEMVARRAEVVRAHVAKYGPISWSRFCQTELFWWPVVPVFLWAMWASRRERWFAPVALWGGFLIIGTLAGIAGAEMRLPPYTAPMQLGLYFPFALAVMARLTIRPDSRQREETPQTHTARPIPRP